MTTSALPTMSAPIKATTTVTATVEANRSANSDTRGLPGRGASTRFGGNLKCQ